MCEDFSPSTVSDEDIKEFENRFQVKLPEILKVYLSTACFDFRYIMAAVPVDIDAETIQDEEYECDVLWFMKSSVRKLVWNHLRIISGLIWVREKE